VIFHGLNVSDAMSAFATAIPLASTIVVSVSSIPRATAMFSFSKSRKLQLRPASTSPGM
jgi:hypothetical protein